MRIGVAADHGGFFLKEELTELLRGAGGTKFWTSARIN